jgi:hypothetical protein
MLFVFRRCPHASADRFANWFANRRDGRPRLSLRRKWRRRHCGRRESAIQGGSLFLLPATHGLFDAGQSIFIDLLSSIAKRD